MQQKQTIHIPEPNFGRDWEVKSTCVIQEGKEMDFWCIVFSLILSYNRH